MFKKLLAALSPPAPPPRKAARVKSLAELEAEIAAELDAEAASAMPENQRRALIKARIQEGTVGDPEAMAALIRSWILEDRT